MLMCNNTITLFYADVVNEKVTYHKKVLTDVFVNQDRSYVRDKTGVTSDANVKLVIPYQADYLDAKVYKGRSAVEQQMCWTIGLSAKDFVCVGEVVEDCSSLTEKVIKAKYENYLVKTIDTKRDFKGVIHRLVVLGV